MTPILAWLLKSIICSGILYSYYLLFLKDKIFNKYNRFYLIAVVIASLILPFLHFSVQQDNYVANTGFQLLTTVIATGGEDFSEVNNVVESSTISATSIGYFLYAIPVLLLLLGFFFSLHSIYGLYQKNTKTIVENVTMVTTDDAPGTPFSFFQYLFWNKNISLSSENGKKILSHELLHIEQKHSLDKVFLQIMQCIFWINPFIWIIKRELSIIHEFLADEQAVAPGDTAAFAEMMLQSAYAGQNFSIANHLSYSSIKRRIKMINKNKNPKMNYLSRIIAIPVIAALVFVSSAYVANNKIDKQQVAAYDDAGKNISKQLNSNNDVGTTTSKINTQQLRTKINSQDPIVILLDAGHGGSDAGAMSFATKAKEKDITLAIVKKIVALNKDADIKFILTRTEDETIMVKNRTMNLSDSVDLVISIHVDAGPSKEQSEKSGLQIYVPRDSYKSAAESKVFASAVVGAFTSNYALPVANTVSQRAGGIWILQALEVPSLLLETGFMNNPTDIAFLISEIGITTIATNVLNGIKAYVNVSTLAITNGGNDSFTFSGKVDGNKITGNGTLNATHSNGNNKVAVVKKPASNETRFEMMGDALEMDGSDNFTMKNISKFSNGGALPSEHIYINGQKVDKSTLDKLQPNEISSVTILKGAAAIKLHGEDAKEGAILIATKNYVRGSYVVDGVLKTKAEYNAISPSEINTIKILDENQATKLYGEKGKNGVIEVTTKKAKQKPSSYQ